jgi:hypothetical protein
LSRVCEKERMRITAGSFRSRNATTIWNTMRSESPR